MDDGDPHSPEQDLLQALVSLVGAWTSIPFQGGLSRAVEVPVAESDVRALYALGHRGGSARPASLADEVQVTRPTMSKMLSRLTQAGLVERSAASDDGRAVELRLTAAGAEAYRRLTEAGLAMVRAAVAGSSATDVRSAGHLIRRVLEEMPRSTMSDPHPRPPLEEKRKTR